MQKSPSLCAVAQASRTLQRDEQVWPSKPAGSTAVCEQAVVTHRRVLCRGTAGARLCVWANARLPLV